MKQGKEYIFQNFLFCIIALAFISMPVCAANTSLTGINVKQNSNNTDVILKLAGNSKIKKIVNSNDNITLILNSAVPSESIDIVYDNTSNINNVIVQKKNNDNTVIMLEGKNIANASIFTKDVLNGNNLTPLNSKTLFFNFNRLSVIFGIMFLLFILCINLKRKHTKLHSINKNIYSKTISSVPYKTTNKFISTPKDFIINRYMEEEKIRKAS